MSLTRQHLRLTWYTIGAVMVLGVLVLSLLNLGTVSAPSFNDKLMHGVAYAGLAFWFGLAFPKRWLAVLIGAISLGVLIELLQYLLPWRAFEWADMVANTLGALAGIAIASVLRHIGIPPPERARP